MNPHEFNTFGANSPAFSNYYSPKSHKNMFQGIPDQISSSLKLLNKSPKQKNQQFTINQKQGKRKSSNHPSEIKIHDPSIASIKGIEEEESESCSKQNTNRKNLYESKVSLILSTISALPFPKKSENELSSKLMELEDELTKQILQLREQKITHMQELNKIIDHKNEIQLLVQQHRRAKLEEETDIEHSYSQSSHTPQQTHNQQYVPLHISATALKRNQQLQIKLKEIQIKQEIFGTSLPEAHDQQEQQILEEIITYRELSLKIKNQMILQKQVSENKMTSSKNVMNHDEDDRFATFFPQDKKAHQALFKPETNEHQRLLQRYNDLKSKSKEISFRLTVEEVNYIEDLRRQNRKLLEEVEMMISLKRNREGSSNNVTELERLVKENEQERIMFFEELANFKEKMKSIKAENQHLKSRLRQI